MGMQGQPSQRPGGPHHHILTSGPSSIVMGMQGQRAQWPSRPPKSWWKHVRVFFLNHVNNVLTMSQCLDQVDSTNVDFWLPRAPMLPVVSTRGYSTPTPLHVGVPSYLQVLFRGGFKHRTEGYAQQQTSTRSTVKSFVTDEFKLTNHNASISRTHHNNHMTKLADESAFRTTLAHNAILFSLSPTMRHTRCQPH